MCGLIAYYKLSGGDLSAKLIEDMTNAMTHRGPDDYGFCYVGRNGPKPWKLPEERPQITGPGVAMGHRRYSIFDLTPAGRQPFISKNQRFTMVFNGEIYNFVELRDELAAVGFEFTTDCDTEVLLAAYQHWGVDSLNKLNGAFAIAVWDDVDKELVVARDRIGEKPMLYTRVGGDWIFTSEIKGLLPHPDVSLQPNEQSIARFIANARNPLAGDSYFAGVHSLEPGTILRIKGERVSKSRYWDLDSMRFPARTDEAQAAEELRELLTDAVKIRMRGDLRVGAMLSGGVDSTSVITSIASVLSARLSEGRSIGSTLQAFTASFPGLENDETDKVEELCALIEIAAHKAFPVEADGVENRLMDVSRKLEAPFWSPAIVVHDMLMNLVGSTDVQVVLDGMGADELFGGYDWYLDHAIRDAFQTGQFRYAWNELQCMKKMHGRNLLKEMARTALPRSAPEHLDRVIRLLKGKGSQWHCGLFNEGIVPLDEARPAPGRGSILEHELKQALLRDNTPKWLHMGDNVSMANRVVCRSPFLDARIVEFAFSLGNEMRIRNGETKYLLREAKRKDLPASIVNAVRKVQFTGPGLQWLHGPLKDFAYSLRDGKGVRLTEFLRPEALRRTIDEFYAKDRGYTAPIWRLLNAEAWLRCYF